MKKILLITFLFLSFSINLFAQADGDYRSNATGIWNLAANWQRFSGGSWGAAPSPPTSADGLITIRTGNTITIDLAVTADQVVIDAGGTLAITAVTFTIADGTGTDLAANGTLNMNSGTINGAGSLLINAIANWNDGTISVPTTVSATGNLILNNPSNKIFGSGTTLTNNGTVQHQQGDLYFNNSTFTNANVIMTGDVSYQSLGGTNSLVNNGSISKVVGTGVVSFGIPTTNSATGTIALVSGNFTNSSTFTNAGIINFAGAPTNGFANTNTLLWNGGSLIGNGIVSNSGTTTLNASLVVPSTITLNSPGTIDGPGDLTVNSNFSFATVTGGGTLTVNADATWTGGTLGKNFTVQNTRSLIINTGANKILGSGTTVTNNGTVQHQQGDLYFTNSTFTNANVIMTGDVGYFDNGGTNSLVNNGSISKIIGTGVLTFGVPTTNSASGSIAVVSGNFSNNSTFTNAGLINFAGAPTNGFSNTNTLLWNGGSLIGSGIINNIVTTTLNVSLVVPSTITLNDPGTINGPGNLTVNSNFSFATVTGGGILMVNADATWTGGTLGKNFTVQNTRNLIMNTGSNKILASGTTLNNNGTVQHLQGDLYFTNSTFTNAAVVMAGDVSYLDNGGTNTLVNNGSISKIIGIGAVTFGVPTINSASGSIATVSGNFSNNSTFTNFGLINITGAPTNVFANNNTVIWNGGSLVGSGIINNIATTTLNVPLVVPSSMTLNDPGTINGPGDLTVNSDFTFVTVTGGGTLTVNADATWTSGSLGKNFTVQNTRTFTLNTSGNKILVSGTTVTNNGTIQHQLGDVYFSGNTLINNSNINFGNVNLVNNGGTNTLTNNGNLVKSGLGTVSIGISTTNNASGHVRGTGAYSFTSTLTNDGNISPGTSPGILAVEAPQPLSANSVLNIEMLDNSGPGTGHDQFVRNGNLTLSGTLNVTELGSVPAGSYVIVNLPLGTISGTFSTTNLPPGYTIVYNPTTVSLNVVLVPLFLISFKGRMVNGQVELNWKTAQEINTSHFVIERSTDGVNFTPISQVNAAGNSNSIRSYQYLDSRPLKGNNHYRLKMTDIDNSYEYSPVVRLNTNGKPVITAKPNPVTDFIKIEGAEGFRRIQIMDVTGKLVKQFIPSADNTYFVPDLKSGIYILRLISDDEVINIQIMKR